MTDLHFTSMRPTDNEINLKAFKQFQKEYGKEGCVAIPIGTTERITQHTKNIRKKLVIKLFTGRQLGFLIASTGTGKSVFLSALLEWFIWAGWGKIIIDDPKDEFYAHKNPNPQTNYVMKELGFVNTGMGDLITCKPKGTFVDFEKLDDWGNLVTYDREVGMGLNDIFDLKDLYSKPMLYLILKFNPDKKVEGYGTAVNKIYKHLKAYLDDVHYDKQLGIKDLRKAMGKAESEMDTRSFPPSLEDWINELEDAQALQDERSDIEELIKCDNPVSFSSELGSGQQTTQSILFNIYRNFLFLQGYNLRDKGEVKPLVYIRDEYDDDPLTREINDNMARKARSKGIHYIGVTQQAVSLNKSLLNECKWLAYSSQSSHENREVILSQVSDLDKANWFFKNQDISKKPARWCWIDKRTSEEKFFYPIMPLSNFERRAD